MHPRTYVNSFDILCQFAFHSFIKVPLYCRNPTPGGQGLALRPPLRCGPQGCTAMSFVSGTMWLGNSPNALKLNDTGDLCQLLITLILKDGLDDLANVMAGLALLAVDLVELLQLDP